MRNYTEVMLEEHPCEDEKDIYYNNIIKQMARDMLATNEDVAILTENCERLEKALWKACKRLTMMRMASAYGHTSLYDIKKEDIVETRKWALEE